MASKIPAGVIGTGFIAAIWPLVTSNLGWSSSASVPVPAETVIITPPPLLNLEPIEIHSFLLFIILAVVVVGAVVVTGIIITGITLLASRFIRKTEESEDYQEGNVALQQREKEKLASKREGRDYTRTRHRCGRSILVGQQEGLSARTRPSR